MQGYILHIQKVRDEDSLVFILTNKELIKSYRFYGARHSIVTQGFKLDFELVENNSFLPNLRNIMHIGFKWLYERHRLAVWQQFMRLLYNHLKGIEIIESFYYDMLESCAYKLEKQNPKRVIVEAYLKILEFEGRLHKDMNCFLCDKKIEDNICLVRGFLPAHIDCINKNRFNKNDIVKLFETKKSFYLNDFYINELYFIIQTGL